MLKHTVYKHFAKNKPKWIFSNAIALMIAAVKSSMKKAKGALSKQEG